jgi:uncharacterized iron-regulated membrane protein
VTVPLVTLAKESAPAWNSITVQVPQVSARSITCSIDEGNGGRPDLRSQLVLERSSQKVRWEQYSEAGPGCKLRIWMRFTHTGEAGGVLGETLAAVVSLGGAVLVWTGISMALHRLRSRNQRKDAVSTTTEAQASTTVV